MSQDAGARTDSPFKTVNIVVPVRDDANRLENCLESVARLDGSGIVQMKVIVVDNGSRDASAEVAARWGARVEYSPGLSVAQLRNRGASCSESDLIAFVDADHTLAVQWLKAGMEAILDPRAGIVGAYYTIPQNPPWVQRAYDRLRRHPSKRTEVEWLGAGNLLIRRHLFEELHGFDESLETCEDVDLCQRARKKGWRVIVEPQMGSIHHGDPASLRDLFFSELWRGRDNWCVTLRGPMTGSGLASLAIPVLNLGSLASILVGLILLDFRPTGELLVFGGLLTIICLIILRAMRMSREAVDIGSIAENLAVAAVYNLARGIALVAKSSYRTRRSAR